MGAKCPISAGDKETINFSLPVLSVYPSISLYAKIEIVADDLKQDYACLLFPAVIVGWIWSSFSFIFKNKSFSFLSLLLVLHSYSIARNRTPKNRKELIECSFFSIAVSRIEQPFVDTSLLESNRIDLSIEEQMQYDWSIDRSTGLLSLTFENRTRYVYMRFFFSPDRK